MNKCFINTGKNLRAETTITHTQKTQFITKILCPFYFAYKFDTKV